MCGGGDKPYDAYKAGDYSDWKSVYDKRLAIRTALAKGEIDQATADQQLSAIGKPDDLLNKIKSDASANMDAREVMRQGDVGIGRIGIDKAFSKFDDGYYNGYKNDYTGYYNPQLEDQYNKAIDKTTAALAGRGMLESTAGINQFGDLTKKNNQAKTDIANEAQDAANKLRGTVQNEKSSLYSLNEASADPQSVNAQAVGAATSLVAPPTYSPLGQVFADAMQGISTYQQARNNAPTRSYHSPYASGFGSGRIVS